KKSRKFGKNRRLSDNLDIPDDMAISIRNLRKTFKTSFFKSKSDVTAIADLSLDIPKSGICVLLGSNGLVRLFYSFVLFLTLEKGWEIYGTVDIRRVNQSHEWDHSFLWRSCSSTSWNYWNCSSEKR